MTYYTETLHYDHDTLMNALSKGRDDYFEMLRRMGMTKIAIPSIRPGHHLSVKERLIFEYRLTMAWKKALKRVKPGDTLVIHSPNSDKFMAFAGLIKRLHSKGCRIVLITFELETFFVMEYKKLAGIKRLLSTKTEASLFDTADSVVVHNDVMKEKLGREGFDTSKMFSVGVMDYLRDEPLDDKQTGRTGRDKPVVFAGDLAYSKSSFLYDLPEGFRCSLYGANFTGEETEYVKHKGVFDPLALMDVMEGSFGLVWDGNSSDGCYGAYGYYLTFNNPHKIALYLASGMPVIVWSRAAMADFVRKERCGLVVDRLREVPDRIAALSEEEYEEMRLSACRVGNEMRQGVHIRAAVENALEYNKRRQQVTANKSRNAYIVFTREPVPGKTKTRLMPYYTAEQCAEIHQCFLRDIAAEMKRAAKRGAFDIIVAYTGGEPVFLREAFGSRAVFVEQRGDDLGQKMENAISDALGMGYEKAVLTGSDIPELKAETIEDAFDRLDGSDVVLGPTADGGYYLIGMNTMHHEAFNAELYGVSTVFEETVASIKDAGLKVALVDEYPDIDTKEDVYGFRVRVNHDPRLRHSWTGRFVMENRKISVIIPVYNEEKMAACMKDQLLKLTGGRNDTEVIFVDGGSRDDTAAVLGDDFRVIESAKGRGLQMNAGAEHSVGDILFFLHCDSILPEDFPDEIKRCMRTRSFGCFGIRFRSRNFFMFTNRIISNHRALMRGLPFGDQGMFIDRELFFEMGMFPEIPVMEDYEFSRTLKRNGIRPVLTRRRLTTSARRYGNTTISIAKTELLMWNLRRLYRKGVSPEKITQMYRDAR